MASSPTRVSDNGSAAAGTGARDPGGLRHSPNEARAPLHVHAAAPAGASGSNGRPASRKKRRRQRTQRGQQRPHESGRGPRVDVVSRERIFQEIEGLLRRIREQAEETACWSEDQLREFTQMVVSFTKSLEQEGDPISARLQSDYQRVRDKLAVALKG